MYIPHLFINVSADGHLGCFHILAIVKKATTNVGVQVSESLLSTLWGIHPEIECLDHMVIVFLIFGGTIIALSIVTVPFYIPINSAQVFYFLHMLMNTC